MNPGLIKPQRINSHLSCVSFIYAAGTKTQNSLAVVGNNKTMEKNKSMHAVWNEENALYSSYSKGLCGESGEK